MLMNSDEWLFELKLCHDIGF
ncbi:hypothetical protein F383_34780 [Gossypium arboreum]|uniref:Uncharacterized protein n=1 Tax=Gossypium arboreum TaxID=29729 RepID=A0A0B0N874_GOSAR|nr:hypothetical protein F383_34780 [Gossypium arboreum]